MIRPNSALPYPILVPQVNRDGIDAGGILIPEVAVPLGTFTGWNYLVPVHPNLGYLGGLMGSFIPLPLTAADRKASGDSRLSVAERYTGRDDYLDKIRAAAESLVSRRLLRADDVNAIVAESASPLGLSGGIEQMKVPYEFVVEALTPLAPRSGDFSAVSRSISGRRSFSSCTTGPTTQRTTESGSQLPQTHHESLRGEFPNMRSIQLFGTPVTSWQVLPVDAPDFEESATRACELIAARDPRIGKIPKEEGARYFAFR